MRQLLKYLKDYKKESILGPLFKLLEASFELIVPLVMASIIDVGIKNQDTAHIWRMGGVLVLLGLIGLVCSITAQYFAAKASVGFGTALRKDLFTKINQLSYAEIDKAGTSSLITRMTSDVNQIQSGVNLVLRLFLRSPFIVVGAMIMAFTINVQAALVFVVAIPLLTIVVFGIMSYSIPLYKKVQRQLDHVLLVTRENLTGVRVIRSVCRQDYEKQRFEESNAALMTLQTFVGKISAFLNPITYIIVNAALIAIVIIGAHKVDNGIITQGKVIALTNYMGQILVELIKLANLIVSITKSLACANRVSEVFSYDKPDVVEKEDAVEWQRDGEDVKEPLLEFEDVSFAYPGAGQEALADINFTVYSGQTIGIIGGTGSGKSSLVNLISRFYDVNSGQIRLQGRDIKDYTLQSIRMGIGVVPQKAVLFRGSLRDNLKWADENATDEEMMQALATAQAKEIVEGKKEGLDLMIEQGGNNLSGGQKQRFTIARALIGTPKILILDDSASALDYATDLRLRRSLKEDTGGRTVFLVSQRAATIKDADQIIVLEDGGIAGIGTHEELLRTCEVYEEICLSQLSREEVYGHEK